MRCDAASPAARAADDEDALFGGVVERLVLRPADAPGPGAGNDDSLRAGIDRGLDQVAGRVLIDHHDVDTWQLLDGRNVEFALGRVALQQLSKENHAIAVDHAEQPMRPALERLQSERIGLRDVASGIDLVVHHDQHALAARGGLGGHTDAFEQVSGAFVAQCARIAHGPDDHHRSGVAHREMQEKGGLLERIGATGHDDSGQARIVCEQFVDPAGKPDPLVERQLAAGDVGELLVGEMGVAFQPRHRLGQVFGAEPTALAIGDGAASGNHMHVRSRLGAGRCRPNEEQSAQRECARQARSGHHCLMPLYTSASHRLSSWAACWGVVP